MTHKLDFFLFTQAGPETTDIRSETRFEHGPTNKPLNPIEKFMSRTAVDQFGFPTYRKIFDAEFEKIS